MITVTRSLVRDIRILFRRALNGSSRGRVTNPVELAAGPGGLRIRAKTDFAAVEYLDPAERESDHLVVPFDLLTDCEGSKNEPVQIQETENGQVTATWYNGSVPQITTYQPAEPCDDFPTWPSEIAENREDFLDALHDAMQTANTEAVRYATNCVQLRGTSGSMAATDGHQLLVQAGFEFPWDEELLIPRTTVFGSPQFRCGEPIRIGRSDKWIGLRSGPWTIYLAMNQDGRFPNVDDHIAKSETAPSSLHVAGQDAEFLGKSLKSLPAGKERNSPVTLDLNGSAAIRAKSPDRPQPVELVLSNSPTSGEDVRLNTDRQYLQRAMKLGFRDVYIFKRDTPILCQDSNRSYVWAPLTPDDAVKPSDEAVRIESPVETGSTRSTPRKAERTRSRVTRTRTTQADKPATNGKSESSEVGVDELLQQSEDLKSSLRDSLAKTNQLISGLKRHKKQAKLVQSTLDSLKRLPGVSS